MAVAGVRTRFSPIQEERYDLVIPLEFLNASAVQAVLDIAVSRPFRRAGDARRL
jgi:molybdate-binding protein